MISAAKLHQLSNLNADLLTEMIGEVGYDVFDEPFINTHFDGVSVGTENLYFSYQAQYVQLNGGLEFANIVVTYDINSGTITTDYA
jgi:hypothetical protein